MWFFFFQAEDGIRDIGVTGVQTCALPMIESMKILGNRQVFFITCKVERPWQEAVNTFLKNQMAKYKNTKLVDWYSLAHNQNQYFAKDRINPNQVGAKVYRGMILEKLED